MSNPRDEKRGRRKALGKGLGALIPPSREERREYVMARIDAIRPAHTQPRKHFEDAALGELARSIEQSGLIQPLVVRIVEEEADDGEVYELIAGERRWRACQLVGVEEVPVVVKDLSDAEAFTIALVENIQRQDLSPIEEALAYQRLVDEYGFTQQALADRVGKSRPAVANALRLLNLHPRIQELVTGGELTAGHARALATLGAEEALELADVMVRHGYTVREAEELVRESKLGELEAEVEQRGADAEEEKREKQKRGPLYRDDAQVRRVQTDLEQALGTRIRVKDRQGKGRIEIHYDDYEVLQDVLDRILKD